MTEGPDLPDYWFSLEVRETLQQVRNTLQLGPPNLVIDINDEITSAIKFANGQFERNGYYGAANNAVYASFVVSLPSFTEQDHLGPVNELIRLTKELSILFDVLNDLPPRPQQSMKFTTMSAPGNYNIEGSFSSGFLEFLRDSYARREVGTNFMHFPAVAGLMMNAAFQLTGLKEISAHLSSATVHNESGWLTLGCAPAGSLYPLDDGATADGGHAFSSTCKTPEEQLCLLIGLGALQNHHRLHEYQMHRQGPLRSDT